MATFAKAGFSAASYATFRPSYPAAVFNTVLGYHRGPQKLAVDLGCGHGLISRALAPSFARVIGTDPSGLMVAQARSSTPATMDNVSFAEASAEDLALVADGSVDVVVAGQAAHWFDYGAVWPAVGRKLRAGGTLAFWGYKDNYFVEYPRATRILDHYCYGNDTMGPFWEQPGRSILRDLYRDIVPPPATFIDVQRITYQPETDGPGSGQGERLMHKKLKLGEVEGYARTFSSFHNWQAANPDKIARAQGGSGDIVDEMFDKMLEAEPEWREKGEAWRDFAVETEWGSVILLARKK